MWYCCIILYFIEKAVVCGIVVQHYIHREGSSVWYCCIILYFIEKAVVCAIVV